MNPLLIIAIYVSLVVSLAQCDVTPAQQKQLIDVHNKYRRDIAEGKVRGQPAASNMIELVSSLNIVP